MQSLREFIAEELSCGEIALGPHEVSVRLLDVRGKGMIAPIEIEVKAFAFEERKKRADEFCLALQKLIAASVNQSARAHRKVTIADVQVWLVLTELGHSWT